MNLFILMPFDIVMANTLSAHLNSVSGQSKSEKLVLCKRRDKGAYMVTERLRNTIIMAVDLFARPRFNP